MKDDKEQSPLNIALECANTSYRSGGVDIAEYLIMNCSCGGEVEKKELLCRACFHGKLNLVKKIIEKHKVHPNGEYNIIVQRIYL